jgi:hypothetical protein
MNDTMAAITLDQALAYFDYLASFNNAKDLLRTRNVLHWDRSDSDQTTYHKLSMLLVEEGYLRVIHQEKSYYFFLTEKGAQRVMYILL